MVTCNRNRPGEQFRKFIMKIVHFEAEQVFENEVLKYILIFSSSSYFYKKCIVMFILSTKDHEDM